MGSPVVSSGGAITADTASPDVELFLLDGFELRLHRQPSPSVPLSVQRLLAFLALRQRPLQRTHVASSLWPDTTEFKARANLRSAVWRLGVAGGELLDVTATHMRLADNVWVDVRHGMAQARRLMDGSSECREGDLCSLALTGDLLADWYDDWVLIERERVRQLRLHALEALCVRLAEAGRLGEAVDAGLVAVAAEPLRESAQVALISAHLREGNRIEAVRQYHHYATMLREELGAEPGVGVEQLMKGVRGS